MIIFMITLVWAKIISADPHVVVSIAPIHSLVSGVMEGVSEPILLLPAGQSPHSYNLSPSKIKSLHNADLIVWIGSEYEVGIKNTVNQIDNAERIKTLSDSIALTTYSVRKSGLWMEHEMTAEASNGNADHQTIDPHLWLSTYNAKEMVILIRAWLISINPENAHIYRRNAKQMISRIDDLNMILLDILELSKSIPYVVFHDAYQYFEREFGLASIGSISLNPERPVSAKRIYEIRKTIQARQAKCIFSEPQFQPKLIPTIIENTQSRGAQLDPLGSTLLPGTDLWFNLMLQLGHSIAACLSTPND